VIGSLVSDTTHSILTDLKKGWTFYRMSNDTMAGVRMFCLDLSLMMMMMIMMMM